MEYSKQLKKLGTEDLRAYAPQLIRSSSADDVLLVSAKRGGAAWRSAAVLDRFTDGKMCAMLRENERLMKKRGTLTTLASNDGEEEEAGEKRKRGGVKERKGRRRGRREKEKENHADM